MVSEASHIPLDMCLSPSAFASPDRFRTRPLGRGCVFGDSFPPEKKGGGEQELLTGGCLFWEVENVQVTPPAFNTT